MLWPLATVTPGAVALRPTRATLHPRARAFGTLVETRTGPFMLWPLATITPGAITLLTARAALHLWARALGTLVETGAGPFMLWPLATVTPGAVALRFARAALHPGLRTLGSLVKATITRGAATRITSARAAGVNTLFPTPRRHGLGLRRARSTRTIPNERKEGFLLVGREQAVRIDIETGEKFPDVVDDNVPPLIGDTRENKHPTGMGCAGTAGNTPLIGTNEGDHHSGDHPKQSHFSYLFHHKFPCTYAYCLKMKRVSAPDCRNKGRDAWKLNPTLLLVITGSGKKTLD